MAYFLQAPKKLLKREVFFLAAAFVSIGFGFFKQIKSFVRSQADYTSIKTEPGPPDFYGAQYAAAPRILDKQ